MRWRMPCSLFYTRPDVPAMLQFYLRMAWSRSFRRCYSLGMLATLMVFHFYHLNVFGDVHELALSSLALPGSVFPQEHGTGI